MNEWLEKNRTIVTAGSLLIVAGGVILFTLRWQNPQAIAIEPAAPTATPGPIRVYVSGAVDAPDVYTLAPGSIVQDALEAAGGPTADAELSALNLASILGDGDQVYIPIVGETPPAPAPQASNTSEANGVINLNEADLEALDSLPGIGPAIAERIIQYREQNGPFATIEDIQNVSGIGPATFEEIKELIAVE